MKTAYLKLDRSVPALGIALVAAGVVAAAAYLNLERKIHAGETFAATLDSLAQDLRISAALKTLHDGEVGAAAQRLDLLLCDSVLLINSQLASADSQTRSYVIESFRRIGSVRPKNPEGPASGSPCLTTADQVAAQRVLALATAGDLPSK